jgi:hypothetical protein
VKAISQDLNSNVFSHTRVYDVPVGDHTFYAVVENYFETGGTGKVSVYGSLTVEWFPDTPGNAFVVHEGVSRANFNVEGAPVILAEQTITTTTSGRVNVRFDGMCISSDGDLLMIAVNNQPTWFTNDGSSSIEIVNDQFNRNCFAHVRSYDVGPGEHTYYAIIENFYETYGNGIATVYGSLTIEFFPEDSPVFTQMKGITQIGIPLDLPTATSLCEVQLNAPRDGKVLLNFSGTCIGSFGDYIKLAANNTPNWGPQDGNLGFEPFSSDRNRTSFSHTRVIDTPQGEHSFYAVAQNVLEFFGSGLAVVYGSLSATFYPNEAVAIEEAPDFSGISIFPNPAPHVLNIELGDFKGKELFMNVIDAQGVLLKTAKWESDTSVASIKMDLTTLPGGFYFLQFTSENRYETRKFIKI